MASARRAAAPLRAAFAFEQGTLTADRFEPLMRQQESATPILNSHLRAASNRILVQSISLSSICAVHIQCPRFAALPSV